MDRAGDARTEEPGTDPGREAPREASREAPRGGGTAGPGWAPGPARIWPVVLCGGSGTRLWPLSRRDYPKQFARLTGPESLFQAALRRCTGPGFAAPMLLTRADVRFLVREQAAELLGVPADDAWALAPGGAAGIAPGGASAMAPADAPEAPRILLEPVPRGTAPAIVAAALDLVARGLPEALMLVLPSDHVIDDPAAFRAALDAAAPAAAAGRLVTFGIRPDRAETGYGWLELGGDGDGAAPGCRPVRRFVEKPDAARAAAMFDAARAAAMLEAVQGTVMLDAARGAGMPEAAQGAAGRAGGGYLWNAGLFLFRADRLLAACAAQAPGLLAPCRAALAGARTDLGFVHLDPAAWTGLAEISIDYAVMEPAAAAGGVVTVPLDGGWSDLGAWEAVRRALGPDAQGLALSGPALAEDCRDSLLMSTEDGPQLVGLGLRDLVVVAMRDAVLVADRRDGAAVGRAVARMKAAGIGAAESFPRNWRPWGWFETLARAPRFQVKHIALPPGRQLSLQSHIHRAEHWIVVAGTARVTIDNTVRLVAENESVYIPLGARHRLENPGKVALHLIEVQTGAYLGEDDITRHEDRYHRP